MEKNKIILDKTVLEQEQYIKKGYKVGINHLLWTLQLKINQIMRFSHTSITLLKIMFSLKLY